MAASVVQYLCVYAFAGIGGGNWAVGFVFAGGFGLALGLINAFLIHQFRIISIVVTISTFNAFFGLLMFFSAGRFLYNLPSWWSSRVILWEYQTANGTWAELILPVAVMAGAMVATWALIRRTTTGRQLYAFGDNPEGARRAGGRGRDHGGAGAGNGRAAAHVLRQPPPGNSARSSYVWGM